MNSPFSDRSMITDPTRFFGRQEQRQAIFNALAAQKPQCVSIIGERRIGRSSLLKHVEQTYDQNNNLPQPDRYRFAYLDLSRDTCRTPHEFYAEAAQAFFGQPYETLTPHQFDDLLIEVNPVNPVNPNQTRYVLLLDEFNVLQRRREQFDDDFYDGLRARANNGDLTFVLASHLPLHEIAVQNNFTSTFFGIFTPVSLKEFSYPEARASILRPTARPLRNKDLDIIKTWLNQHYHPLKINMAANLIWHGLPSPEYEQLEFEYRQQVAHAFGQNTRELRRKIARQKRLYNGLNAIKGSTEWIFTENRYIIIIIIVGLLLLLSNHITPEQLLEMIIPDAGSTPTVVPTP